MKKFKTESQKLLDLMINSIYTNREIFLRELISNASDAVDKLYFKSLTDSSITVTKDDLFITVSFDRDARTITVEDSGIGMTKEELDKNLGTIAHSDSNVFKTENADDQGGDALDIIGQFGVGFYSAFMVAKKVTVLSRAWGADDSWVWTSDGVAGYNITEGDKQTHGTIITLDLKDNTDEDDFDIFLSEAELTSLIKRYSNYVRYPIKMEVSKTVALPKPEGAGEDYKTQYETVTEIETINSMIPIWKRRKSEVTQEEYDEFYKTDFHDYANPLRTISMHAEGTLSYDALLYIPSHAPYDLYSKDYKKGLALYTSNVLIMDKCEELLPDYFNFVRGVVDSQDLTLNISRETLQHNGQLHAIARRLEKKIKSDLLALMADDREAYEGFFKDFGRGIKYGIYASFGQDKDKLADLLMFYSATEKKMVTLDEYLEKAEEDQKAIYYATGESVERLSKMPTVTAVLNKGYDVLLCTQDVDEFCMMSMNEYAEHAIQNVASSDLDLETQDEKDAAEALSKENEALFNAMKEALGDKVSRVAVSTRLSDTPAAVTTEGPISLEMERMMAMTPDGEFVKASRVLEVNPNHPVFETLQNAEKDNDSKKIELYTTILYNQALIVENMPIEDPVAYSQAVCSLMK